MHTLCEKSYPRKLPLQLPCLWKQNTAEILIRGKSFCHLHVIASLEYSISCR